MQRKSSSTMAKVSLFIVTMFVLTGVFPVSARGNSFTTFNRLDFVANIETIGIAVSGTSLPQSAELTYRAVNETNWRMGHPLMRIDDGRLVGSLFGLSASTSYEIKVRNGSSEISGTVATQADEIQFVPTTILRVDDDAPPGGNGSISAPFKKIGDAINRAAPGTQILVADGIYRESITFPTSGSNGNWIQLKAESSGAILDGSKDLSGAVWTYYAKNIWYTKINSYVSYLARDGQRYYMYDNLKGLADGIGHNKVPMPEGWYVAPGTNTLYVRSLNHPSKHTWQVPFLNIAIDTNAHDWLWVEGFEIRYYGAQYGCGICLKNASHVMIRKNKIHHIQKGILIEWTGGEAQGNDTRIEYNEIYDSPVNEWAWSAVKATSMEGTGIILRGHIGAIVRGNELHHLFNGIYTGSSGDAENSALAFDADIYNNRIHHISDDAYEPEGACINQRFRNNSVDTVLVGVSLAPVTKGPVWVLRSTFANYTSRGIKLDRGSDGLALIYHNTFWTTKNSNAVDLISAAYNVTMRNNIFQTKGYGIYEVAVGSKGNNWNYDNFYTTTSPRFKWENKLYENTAKLCRASGLECNGHESAPGLSNPGGGDFSLLASSPNIDRGVSIAGINNYFYGKAPDIGAYESTFGAPPVIDPTPTATATPDITPTPVIDSPPAALSITRTDANPSGANEVKFIVTFSEPVSGVDVSDFSLSISNITGAYVSSVTSISELAYTASINSGAGDGTIRLDILDDDSIRDAGNNPLGGIGAGNGNFNAGEIYSISKSPVTVIDYTLTFNSIGTQDGWVLESGEGANKGGALDRVSPVINLGDDDKDKQYQGILSFNTDALPDDAIITSAQVIVKKQGVVGTNPLSTHGGLFAEVSKGPFSGNSELVLDDFSAASSAGSIPERFSIYDPFYTITLNGINLGYINKNGATQFRLYFVKDDNDDMSADYLKIFSGNAAANDQPLLVITYSIQTASAAALPLAQKPINQTPVITSNSSISISENATATATITAADSESLTYSIIGGADAALFSLDAVTGELRFISAPDFELPTDSGADNIYNITTQVSDGELSAAQDVSVSIMPMNDNIPVITSAPSFQIAENTAAISMISATDTDSPTQPLTYSMIGGADAALFHLDAVTGELRFISAPDFELPADSGLDNIYNITIQVSDGELSAAQEISVTVTPINDNAPVITSTPSFSVAENTAVVSTITATDADLPAQPLTYSVIGGADAEKFSIDNSGALTFKFPPDYESPADAGADNIYNVLIKASDGEFFTAREIFIHLTPVNDNAPLITSTENLNIPENSLAIPFTVKDADLPIQPLTYSIIGGADAEKFEIAKDTGLPAFISAPNFESPADANKDNIYEIAIQASDGTWNVTQNIKISVADVSE